MDNKEVIRRYWNGKWNERRPDILDETQAPNVSYRGPGIEMSSRDEYKAMFEAFMNAFHDTQLSIEDLIAEGDRVVSRITLRALHKGDLPGLPAKGKPVEVQFTTIFRLVDGLIVEEIDSFNQLELMQQTGAIEA